MNIEWKSIGLIVLIIFIMLLIIKLIDKKIKLNGEVKRKLFHTSMGLTMLLLPHLFTSVFSVLTLGIIALVILYFLKNTKLKKSLGSVLYDIDRESMRRSVFCNFSFCNLLPFKRRQNFIYNTNFNINISR